MPDEPDIAQLIADSKGTRSYERMSRDCGGSPTDKRLQQMATTPLRAFPDRETLEGLARGTGSTLTSVVLAAARSLGLPVHNGEDPSALVIGGGASLAPDQREAARALVASFFRSNEAMRVEAAKVKLADTRDLIARAGALAADESVPPESAMSTLLRERLGATVAEVSALLGPDWSGIDEEDVKDLLDRTTDPVSSPAPVTHVRFATQDEQVDRFSQAARTQAGPSIGQRKKAETDALGEESQDVNDHKGGAS